jgi:O-antigen/teichoic acid export membrane protein
LKSEPTTVLPQSPAGNRTTLWLRGLAAPSQQESNSSFTQKASWILLARVASFIFATVLPLLLVRRLHPLEFGLYKQVFLVVNSAIGILPLGFAMNAYYFLPREPTRQKQTIFNTLIVLTAAGLLGSAVLLLFPQVLVFVSREPAIVPFAPLIAAMVVLWIVGAFFENVPIANHEMKFATVVIVCGQLTRTLFLVAAAVFFGTVASLIWAAILHGALLVLAMLVYFELRFPRFWAEFDRSLLRAQLSYSLPLGITGLVWTFQSDLHNYFVSHRFGATAFAIYAIGCFQIPLIQLLTDSVGIVLIPQVAHLQKQGETEEIIGLTLRAVRKVAAVTFPIYAFLLVTGHEFIAFLFTTRYSASWPIFMINITLIPFTILLTDPIARAYAEYRHRVMQVQIVLFLALLVTLWWGTSRFGMVGAISAAVGGAILNRLFMCWMFAGAVHFGWKNVPQLGDVGKLALSAAGAAASAYGVRTLLLGAKPVWVLIGCGAAFVPAYGGLAYLLGTPQAGELAFLRQALVSPFALLRSRRLPDA